MGWIRKLARRVLRRSPRSESILPTAPEPGPDAIDGAQLATITCDPQELLERIQAGESVTVVDVRQPHERGSGALPDARFIPLGQLDDRWEELSDADEIVCYCAAGRRSEQAALTLRSKGLINATSLDGGIAAWRRIEGPISFPE